MKSRITLSSFSILALVFTMACTPEPKVENVPPPAQPAAAISDTAAAAVPAAPPTVQEQSPAVQEVVSEAPAAPDNVSKMAGLGGSSAGRSR